MIITNGVISDLQIKLLYKLEQLIDNILVPASWHAAGGLFIHPSYTGKHLFKSWDTWRRSKKDHIPLNFPDNKYLHHNKPKV